MKSKRATAMKLLDVDVSGSNQRILENQIQGSGKLIAVKGRTRPKLSSWRQAYLPRCRRIYVGCHDSPTVGRRLIFVFRSFSCSVTPLRHGWHQNQPKSVLIDTLLYSPMWDDRYVKRPLYEHASFGLLIRARVLHTEADCTFSNDSRGVYRGG